MILACIPILNGCSSYTIEEIKDISTKSLNIYEDNRVLVKTDETYWMYPKKKDTILALKINVSNGGAISLRYYNAKDIIKVTSRKTTDSSSVSKYIHGPIIVYLKNGQNITGTSVGKSDNIKSINIYWTVCNKNKDCFNKDDQIKLEYGTIIATSEKDIKNSDLTRLEPKSWPKIYPIEIRTQQFDILDASEIEQLEKRITEAETTHKQAYKERYEKISREVEDKTKRAAEKFERDMRTAENAGQLSCTSSGYNCQGYPFGDKTLLQCGFNELIRVGELKYKGWVVANVNSQFTPKSYDNLCEHYQYQVYLKK